MINRKLKQIKFKKSESVLDFLYCILNSSIEEKKHSSSSQWNTFNLIGDFIDIIFCIYFIDYY